MELDETLSDSEVDAYGFSLASRPFEVLCVFRQYSINDTSYITIAYHKVFKSENHQSKISYLSDLRWTESTFSVSSRLTKPF